jgi:hypothetical protein
MQDNLFLHPDRLSISEFAAQCEQPLTLSDYPLAAEAQKKVLIYRGQTLLDGAQTDKAAVFGERPRRVGD